MKIGKIKESQKFIESGAWVTSLPNLPGVAVKVRGLFNSDATRMFSEARMSMSEEEFRDEKVQDALDVRIVNETILLDWDGLEDDDGDPIEYDPETAETLLTDPELVIFRRAVNFAAANVATMGKANLENAAKN